MATLCRRLASQAGHALARSAASREPSVSFYPAAALRSPLASRGAGAHTRPLSTFFDGYVG